MPKVRHAEIFHLNLNWLFAFGRGPIGEVALHETTPRREGT